MKSKKVLLIVLLIIPASIFIGCSDKVFGKFPTGKSVQMGYGENTPYPKMKDLFGSKAKFATSYNGKPCTVTFDVLEAEENNFSAKLLLSQNDEGLFSLEIWFANFIGDVDCYFFEFVNLKTGKSMKDRYEPYLASAEQLMKQNRERFYKNLNEITNIFWDL